MLKFAGGVFLIIGAVIGGGILAIPIVSAQFGFLTTLALIIAAWLVMTTTGLYVLSLCLSCPEKYNSYYSIVEKFLGSKVKWLTVFLYLWLLYLSLSSSISGCVSLVLGHLTSTSWFSANLLFVVVAGALIVISAKIIIRLNVLLVTLKLGLLLLAMGAVFSTTAAAPVQGFSLFQHGGLSLPMIIINAFGYQFIIPSLVSWYGRDNQASLTWIIVMSTSLVLCLYTAWLYTIYAIIPMQGEHGLLAIYQSANQLMAINQSLLFYMHSGYVIHLLSAFESIALFGSFLCVSLGVFDFLLDMFKTDNRWIVGLSTFIPPLLLTLLSENMYVYAMSAAGYIAIVLEIIIPACAIPRLSRRCGV